MYGSWGSICEIEFSIVSNREQTAFRECSPLSLPVQHGKLSGQLQIGGESKKIQ